jgi:hypothetical protein
MRNNHGQLVLSKQEALFLRDLCGKLSINDTAKIMKRNPLIGEKLGHDPDMPFRVFDSIDRLYPIPRRTK